MFDFENVTNAFLPPEGFSRLGYGQLGCSGFVVIDNESGCFVSKRTKAFLDYGEMAFVHVEAILAAMMEDDDNDDNDDNTDNVDNVGTIITKVHVASTGNDAMDEEHKQCTDSLNQTINKPTKQNLVQLYSILKSHFDHEELLMKTYFDKAPLNGSTVSTSTVELHMRDHARILKVAQTEIDRINGTTTIGRCKEEGKT